MTNKRLTYTAAAELLGIGVPTLRSMVHRKQVPHYRLSAGMVVFDTDELGKWLPGIDAVAARTMQAELDEKKRGRDLYAVFCTVTRLCKIGRANDAIDRLSELQVGSPTRLILWCHAPMLGHLERRMHRAFGWLSSHGEWFRPALTETIAGSVPLGDVAAFSTFASDACAAADALNRAAKVAAMDRAAKAEARKHMFEWRGKLRPR